MTKKNKIIIGSVIGGVVVLGAIGSASGGSEGNTSSNSYLNSESSYVSTIESNIPDNVSSLVISTSDESSSAESSDMKQEEIPEPRETAIGKSDKSVDGLMTIEAISVHNDNTGTWRYSGFSESGLDMSEYALSYYKEYFKSDEEIHAVINFANKTTTRISCANGMLFVTVMEYVDGEEHDADLMFSGKTISDFIIYTDNGDIEALDTPACETTPALPEAAPATTATTPATTTTSPATTQQIADVVYIAATGKGTKYHKDPNCSKMDGNVIKMTREEAETAGYGPCKKNSCYGSYF